MAGVKKFKKLRDDKADIRKVQDNIESALNPVLNCPIIDGVLVKEAVLDPTRINEVEHTLGRKPRGWFLVRKRADSRIWDVQEYNTNPSRTLSLACSHSVTVDIWIF